MRLSANTRYAIRAVIELCHAGGSVPIPALAEKMGMSLKVVEHIHGILRVQGITASTIGAKGGIRLAVPLEDISLGRMIALFDEGVQFSICFGNRSNDCPRQDECPTQNAWGQVSEKVQAVLDTISLASVLEAYPDGGHMPEEMPVICLGR